MPVQLQILNGKRQGAVFDLSRPGDLCVGQRETAQIRIDDPWVSWDHARLYQQGSEFWVEDLASTNGTYVNCQRIKRSPLSHEDILFFGKTHALFLITAESGNASDYQRSLDQAANSGNFWTQPGNSGFPQGIGDSAMPLAGAPSGSTFPLDDPLGVGVGDSAFGSPSASGLPARRMSDPFSSGDENSSGSDDLPDLAIFGSQSRPNLFDDGGGPDPFGLGPPPGAAGLGPPGGMPGGPGPFDGQPFDGPRFDESQDELDPGFGGPNQPRRGPPPSQRVNAGDIEKLLSTSGIDDLDDLLSTGLGTPPPTMNSGVQNSAISSMTGPLGSGAMPFTPPPPPPDSGPIQLGEPPLPPPGVAPSRAGAPPPAAKTRLGPVAGDQSITEAHAETPRAEIVRRLSLLQGENNRLRAAFQAAGQAGHSEVKGAADRLRNDEVTRLNQQLADSRAKLAELQEILESRTAELDTVTEEMIEKEDLIDSLKQEVEELRSRPVTR